MSELFYKAAGAILAPFRYAEREVNHMKEVAKEDIQALIANVVKMMIIGAAGFLGLMFLSIMAANIINASMQSEYLGYAIVAGFYLVIAIALYIWKSAAGKRHEEHSRRQAAPH